MTELNQICGRLVNETRTLRDQGQDRDQRVRDRDRDRDRDQKSVMRPRPKTTRPRPRPRPVQSNQMHLKVTQIGMFYFVYYTHEVNDEPEIDLAFN